MTKLIQTIASWPTDNKLGESITNPECSDVEQGSAFCSTGSPPSSLLLFLPHLCSCLHRLNCIVTSAFQECDSCPWPPLQINTACPLLLSALGRMSATQERADKGKTGEDVFHLLFFSTILLDFTYKALGSGVKRSRPGVPGASRVA